ncbi:MAG: hypothetical protein AW07_04433 [Candidatus Accumulibacter sp. SK-11]|nr:MAG: hypothetical protein AW07_04433 [Candidatus Accumulibacter sp. SK-11]
MLTSRSSVAKRAPRLARAARSACCRPSPGTVSAACAKTIWRAAIGERKPSAIPGRLRKKVSWKPTSACGASRAPVTYHHSVRKSGWAP